MKMRRALLLVLCISLWAGPPARPEETPAKPAAVPFKLLPTRHITVQITINGKGPYRVVFDTGSPFSLISSKVAKEAGLSAKGGSSLLGLNLFGSIEPVKARSLKLGAVSAENVPFLVMDHPTVEAMASAFGPIDGILGFPFFARYRMTLDYQSEQMTFVPNGYEPTDILQALMNSLMSQNKAEPRLLAPLGLWGFSVEKEGQDEAPGVILSKVLAGGPAALAGLQVGDRLLILDDRWTDSVADCYAAATVIAPGTEVRGIVRRHGKEMEIKIRPVAGL